MFGLVTRSEFEQVKALTVEQVGWNEKQDELFKVYKKQFDLILERLDKSEGKKVPPSKEAISGRAS